MASKPMNKSALVRDFLAKYPEKMPAEIARQISQERGMTISGKFVATIKTKVKQAGGSPAAAAARPKPVLAAAQRKPAHALAKTTAALPERASASAAALSQHIAKLKAAAHRLGKDEAKRIIDLF